MNFNEYQKKSRETAVYPDKGKNYIYTTLGLAGETGEVADKISKIIRDKDHELDEATLKELAKEMGDVLWFLANLATELGLSLDEIASSNIEKLFSRKDRGTLHGDGDNR